MEFLRFKRRNVKLEQKDVITKENNIKRKVDNYQRVKFQVEVKSHLNHSKEILGSCLKLNGIKREEIERSKEVTNENSKVKKGELKLRVVTMFPQI